jgi:hypothetical protein
VRVSRCNDSVYVLVRNWVVRTIINIHTVWSNFRLRDIVSFNVFFYLDYLSAFLNPWTVFIMRDNRSKR